MARPSERLPQNLPGEFYVDSSCIDCDACRQIAPAVFRDHGGQSSVYRQPRNPGQVHRALMALVACPTASIGSDPKRDATPGVAAFPARIAMVAGENQAESGAQSGALDNIYFCGFTAESSFGAWSYLIVRPEEAGGNVLIDSPRFTLPLVRKIEQMGGVRLMFLSHRDDIADHAKFAAHFQCPRVMHRADGAAQLQIERLLEDTRPARLDRDLLAIPTPGHTRGHVVLLYRDQVLFTGDHLAWHPERQTLTAFRDACWYSWAEQIRSMEGLLGYRFEWVLPGHGRIGHATAESMHAHLQRCVTWMKGIP
jgi:glyoxylase-like metal-dependent hydrolase (beta-lactamase superfamily II)/ferredoxin